VSSYTACHICGEVGHYARQCAATPPPEAPGTLQGTPRGSGLPASYLDIETLRQQRAEHPAEECAELADRYGSQIRAAMGWGVEEREGKLRALALAQVDESRSGRAMWEGRPGTNGAAQE
jgi:hypothetical protein